MQRHLLGFGSMLSIAMALSTFSLFALAVTASDLEAEFGLSKFQLGLIGAVNTGVGGLFAPTAGRLSDILGGRRAVGGVILLSGISAALAALAQSYAFLLVAMAVTGLPQGWGNPATNRAIAGGIPADRRGVVTGVKQSGVQLATFTSGFAMPPIADAYGWRGGMWLVVGVSAVAMLGLPWITEDEGVVAAMRDAGRRAPGDDSGDAPARSQAALPPFVYQVALYGFLLGIVGGSVGRFLPLFGEESVGVSTATAGVIFGVAGLVAIPSRIAWGVYLDRGFSTQRALLILGIGAVVSMILLAAAASAGTAVLWIAAILGGLSVGSWNTAANLAMIQEAGLRGAGRASGVLLFGFLIGLTVGAPLAGLLIDATDGYVLSWIGGAVLAALGTAAVARRR